MSFFEKLRYQPLGPEDPDDYRPETEVAFLVDPITQDGRYVRSLSFIFEKCAPGDAIPLHTHAIDEAIVVDEGALEATVGNDTKQVGTGGVVFIPAGVSHSLRNASGSVVRIHGVFPSDVIDIRYLERNPAPGTEGEPPQPPFVINLRDM